MQVYIVIFEFLIVVFTSHSNLGIGASGTYFNGETLRGAGRERNSCNRRIPSQQLGAFY
jgi:hypothetical protein